MLLDSVFRVFMVCFDLQRLTKCAKNPLYQKQEAQNTHVCT